MRLFLQRRVQQERLDPPPSISLCGEQVNSSVCMPCRSATVKRNLYLHLPWGRSTLLGDAAGGHEAQGQRRRRPGLGHAGRVRAVDSLFRSAHS